MHQLGKKPSAFHLFPCNSLSVPLQCIRLNLMRLDEVNMIFCLIRWTLLLSTDNQQSLSGKIHIEPDGGKWSYHHQGMIPFKMVGVDKWNFFDFVLFIMVRNYQAWYLTLKNHRLNSNLVAKKYFKSSHDKVLVLSC